MFASQLCEHAHEGGGLTGPPPGAPVLHTASLYLLVTLAGLLMAPLLTRTPCTARVRQLVVYGLAGMYALAFALMVFRGEAGVRTGTAVLLVILAAVGAVRRGTVTEQAAAGAALIVVQTALTGVEDGAEHLAFIAVHLVAASVWAGGVVHFALVATVDRSLVGATVRRCTPYAVGSAFTLVASGYVLLLLHDVRLGALPHTGFGRLVLAKAAGLAAAGLLGLALHNGSLRRRRVLLIRGEALTLTTVVALAAVLVGVPDPVAAVTVPAAAPRCELPVRTLAAAEAVTLRKLGIRRVDVVSDAARRHQVFAATLVARFGPAATVVSPRTLHTRQGVGVVLATARDTAARVLGGIARTADGARAASGVVLAPWLLDGVLLERSTTLTLPPIIVATALDPMSPVADRYRAALADASPGQPPSAEGLAAFLSVVRPEWRPTRFAAYAATPVGFLPGVLDAGHEHGPTDSWFPHGTLVAISSPTPITSHCS